LCDNAFCLRCRELERRLNLYDSIENPRFFQKNLVCRTLINLRNIIILRRYTRFSLKSPKQNRIPDPALLAEYHIPNLVGSIYKVLRGKKN